MGLSRAGRLPESAWSPPGPSFPGFRPDLGPPGCQDCIDVHHLSPARVRECSSVAFTAYSPRSAVEFSLKVEALGCSSLVFPLIPAGSSYGVTDVLPPKLNSAQRVDAASSHFPQGAVSPVWEQACLRAFALSVPGAELDACLWSLTEALKGLLRGAWQGWTQLLFPELRKAQACALAPAH